MQLPWLEETNFIFPNVDTALTEPDGLLAASERLTPELVLDAYKHGIFPWYSEGQPVLWWSPNPRCVLYPEKFHVSRSFKRVLNNNPFEIKTNTAFREVMLACAEPRIIKNKNEMIMAVMAISMKRAMKPAPGLPMPCWTFIVSYMKPVTHTRLNAGTKINSSAACTALSSVIYILVSPCSAKCKTPRKSLFITLVKP